MNQKNLFYNARNLRGNLFYGKTVENKEKYMNHK